MARISVFSMDDLLDQTTNPSEPKRGLPESSRFESCEFAGYIPTAQARGGSQAGNAASARCGGEASSVGQRETANESSKQSRKKCIAGAGRVDDRSRRRDDFNLQEFAGRGAEDCALSTEFKSH